MILYKADTTGNIYGLNGKLLKLYLCSSNYLRFKDQNQLKHIYAHRFTWAYFNGVIPKGFEINHIDGNKHNNALTNLELCTRSENMKHAFKLGLVTLSSQMSVHNNSAKLSENEVKKIKILLRQQTPQRQIAKLFSITQGAVSFIKLGKRWANVT